MLKSLKLDEGGVHVRLCGNQFVEPPTKIDERALYMAGMNRKPGESLEIGHAPISKKSFAGWNTKFVQKPTEAAIEGGSLLVRAWLSS